MSELQALSKLQRHVALGIIEICTQMSTVLFVSMKGPLVVGSFPAT
jgi:hypothetical protein